MQKWTWMGSWLAVVLLAIAVGTEADPPLRATAVLEPTCGSCAPGSEIEAQITFLDNGHNLIVSGTAEGMVPGTVYRSLIYDIQSDPDDCVAVAPPGSEDDIRPTMLLGFWRVRHDGRGTLTATNTNDRKDYVPLDKIGTVSVRLAPGMGPNLQSCGDVLLEDD